MDESPLFLALRLNRLDIAEYLIDNGAYLNVYTKAGISPLSQSILNNKPRILQKILD